MLLSSASPITQNKIPKVKEICEALDFGPTSDRPNADLTDSTQIWRKGYTTSRGLPGRSLIDWRNADVRQGLRLMAQDFLEHGDYGRRKWPSVRRDDCARWPIYPRDKIQ